MRKMLYNNKMGGAAEKVAAKSAALFVCVLLCFVSLGCGGGGGGGGSATGGWSYGRGESGSPANTGRLESTSIGFNKDKPITITQSSGSRELNWSSIDLTVYKNGVAESYTIDDSMTLNLEVKPGMEVYAEAVIHAATGDEYTASSDKIIIGAGSNRLTLHINYTITFKKTGAAYDANVVLPSNMTYNSRGVPLPAAGYTDASPPRTFTAWYFDKDLTRKCTTLKGVTGNLELYPAFVEGIVEYTTANYNDFTTFTVKTADQLDQIAALLRADATAYSFSGRTIELDADLIANPGFVGLGKARVGSDDFSFKGTFDGKNHTVKVAMNQPTEVSAAFVQHLATTGVVKNLKITGSISGGTSYCAGIVGFNEGTVEACCNAATVSTSTTEHAGGIVGRNQPTGVIQKCYNTANITNTYSNQPKAGGICSWNYGTVTNVYNTGGISASWSAGGIAASTGTADKTSTIQNCWNSGSVSSGNNIVDAKFGTPTLSNLYCNGTVSSGITATGNLSAAGALAITTSGIWQSNDPNPPTLIGVP